MIFVEKTLTYNFNDDRIIKTVRTRTWRNLSFIANKRLHVRFVSVCSLEQILYHKIYSGLSHFGAPVFFWVESEELIMNEQTKDLTLLGNKNVKYSQDYCPEVLETFENKHPDNDYFVKFNCPEFTSLCPITGQPDFATIYISYVPNIRMVESKSLKLYLFGFRNHGDFHEDCVNIIMKDLIRLMDPKYIEVWGKFLPRGGISIDPYCNYGKAGTKWEAVAWDRLSKHDRFPEIVNNR